MGWLGLARLGLKVVPFGRLRTHLGPSTRRPARRDPATARQLAAHVARAAGRLPFATKCLPQAMALGWMLRRRGIDHSLVIAVRTADQGLDPDRLHAWLAVGEEIVLGDLPGPWLVLFRIGPAGRDEVLEN